ncbi:MAG TPA: prolyl oligopeptidase family serine peptidase, partial [Gaiellales bacterium]|nr:prolyl oligopeptidase family serine peptidase [Gaiellales bacterium]
MPPTARRLGPDVVDRQVAISSPAVAPDGRRVVYVRRTVERGGYRSGLWIVPAAGGRARRLTGGAHSDSCPSWSPDGTRIAFLSDRDGGVRRLYLIDPDGGEAELVCGAGDGLAAWPPAFSPDGRRIAFAAWSGGRRFWVGPPDARLAREIRTVDWRDDSGDANDRHSRLLVVAARPGARPRVVVGDGYRVEHPAWHPDCDRIAFEGDPGADADLRPRPRILEVAGTGGEPRELVRLAGAARLPSWSPDGSQLAFVGVDVEHSPDWAEPELWLLPQPAPARSLSHRLDIPVTFAFGSDLHDWIHAYQPPPLWLDDRRIAVPVNRRGATEVAAIATDGGVETLLHGQVDVSGLAVAAGTAVAVISAGCAAPELAVLTPSGPRTLTRDGGGWLRRHRQPSIRAVDAGGVPAYLLEPPGAGPASALVLHVHGGPWGAWGPTPELGDLLLAELGYRVLLPNPCGSCGFGREWVRQLQGRWGEPDAEDLRSSVDWALGAGLADPARLALVGL